MKNKDDNIPKFYCKTWIEQQGYLEKYRSEKCMQQCHKCMDEIIDHHFNKKPKTHTETK